MLSRYKSGALAMPMFFCLSLQAATPVDVQKFTIHQLQKQFNLHLPGEKPLFKAPSSHALTLVVALKDKTSEHLRMQQTYEGFVVLGGYAIVHHPISVPVLRAPEEKVSMNGQLYEALDKDLGTVPLNFVQQAEEALNAFKAAYPPNKVSDATALPIVYIDEQAKAHWAYQVSFLLRHPNAVPEKPSAIVDASTYKPFVTWNDMHTSIAQKARGHGGNIKTSRYNYDGSAMPLLEISRNKIAKDGAFKCSMENKDVRVVDMKRGVANKTSSMSFPCRFVSEEDRNQVWTGYAGDGYDSVNGAYSPSNDALYAGQVIKRMYREWFGFEALLKPDLITAMQLIMRVHYDKDYANAFWYKGKMHFGDGNEDYYPLVSLGIAAHEVSHGFTEQHANFMYFGHSGGIDESFSDMAAQTAEYYAKGDNHWTIGAEIIKASGEEAVLRYMDMPSKDGESIDQASDYSRGMDPHHSSGLYNRLFYLMSHQDESWNARRAFAIMVRANAYYWTPYSTFDQGACGILTAAQQLKEPLEGIKKSMDMVGLNYKACK